MFAGGFASFLVKDIVGSVACQSQEQVLHDGDFSVRVTTYFRGTGRGDAILIMPPTGGENSIDRSYGRHFCAAGFDVYILKGWTGDDEYNLDFGIHQRLYERSQRAVSRVLKEVPEGNFVGVLGTSLGAVYTAIAMGIQERLKAAFVIVGGAPISSLIAFSDQQAMLDAKQKRITTFGAMTDVEYAAKLSSAIKWEPLRLPRLFEGKKLGMVIAENDTTVPGPYQKNLEKFWNPETVFRFEDNHFWSIVKTWLLHRGEVVRFFTESAQRK